jgi:hypothetical protein
MKPLARLPLARPQAVLLFFTLNGGRFAPENSYFLLP